jgi:predicted HTH transcriptional regulator
MILNGETEAVEFKSTLRFDLHKGDKNDKLEYAVIKTIAAFMNTDGGTLIIGVDDNQNILGLDADIQTLKKKNIDGFQLHLLELYKSYIGADLSSYIKVSFPEIGNRKVCVIKISNCSRPIFTKFEGREDYYVRVGCASQPLSREEQSRHEKQRRA